MVKIILNRRGYRMKKRKNYFREKRIEEIQELGYEDYMDMFQEGMSDSEISNEVGVDEKYIKRLREEYQNDF
jgi:hypothetical protein